MAIQPRRKGVPGRGPGNASRHFESRHKQGAAYEPAGLRAAEKWRSFSREPVTSVQARVQPSGSGVPLRGSVWISWFVTQNPNWPHAKERFEWRIVDANLAEQCLVFLSQRQEQNVRCHCAFFGNKHRTACENARSCLRIKPEATRPFESFLPRDGWPQTPALRDFDLLPRIALRLAHLSQAEKSPRAQVHARNLRTHLRNLQNLSGHARQIS